MSKSDCVVVFITTPSKEVARRIAKMLLEKKLAACVNIVPSINSIYMWKGEICDDEEVLLIVKSSADKFEGDFVPNVQAEHPYDLPEIIALPIVDGSKSYLEWIQKTVNKQ